VLRIDYAMVKFVTHLATFQGLLEVLPSHFHVGDLRGRVLIIISPPWLESDVVPRILIVGIFHDASNFLLCFVDLRSTAV